MKTQHSIQQSQKAALRIGCSAAARLAGLMAGLERGLYDVEKSMPLVRSDLAELTQRVHEFNALDNVLNTK